MFGFWQSLPKYGIAAAGFEIINKFRSFHAPTNQKQNDSKRLELYETLMESPAVSFMVSMFYNREAKIQNPPLPLDIFKFHSTSLDVYKDHEFFDMASLVSLNSSRNLQIGEENSNKATEYKDALLRIFKLNWFVLYDEDHTMEGDCYKGQKDLAFQPLVFLPSRKISTTPRNCEAVENASNNGNFENEANKIVATAEKFAKELGNKLVHLTDYLMHSAADGRPLELLKKVLKDVAMVVKNVFVAITDMVNKILSALNEEVDDETKKAQNVAETCAECMEETSKKFFDEADTLTTIKETITNFAGPTPNTNAISAVEQLDNMSKSVRNYASKLKSEGEAALEYIKSLST